MRVGIAADHAGFTLKEQLAKALRESGHEVLDFGSSSLTPKDDYPDYVVPLARSVTRREVERGLAPYAQVYEPPPSFGVDMNQVKLVLEVVGQAVSVAGGVGGIFTFLWAAKDRAAKQNRRTNITIGRIGEPPLALDDADEDLLRRLLGLEGER